MGLASPVGAGLGVCRGLPGAAEPAEQSLGSMPGRRPTDRDPQRQ